MVNKSVEDKPNKIKEEEPKIITIVVGKDDVNAPEYPVPQALMGWSGAKSVSKEYREMMERILTMACAIAKQLNEGPEVKDSILKRTQSLRNVLLTILTRTFMDGYHRLGVLEELSHEIDRRHVGQRVIHNFIEGAEQSEEIETDKEKKKMGYVA